MLFATVLIVGVLRGALPASADGGQGALGSEVSYNNLSGVQSFRSDPLSSTVNARFLRGQWIYDYRSGGKFTALEFGTYHCPSKQGCRVEGGTIFNNEWYGYYVDDEGHGHLVFHEGAGPGPNHYFSLYWWWPGSGDDYWVWQVDNTVINAETAASFTPDAHWGDEAVAGLERFSPPDSSSANLGAHTSSSLKVTDGGSAWVPWAGQELAVHASNMCSGFLSDTSLRTGQPASTC